MLDRHESTVVGFNTTATMLCKDLHLTSSNVSVVTLIKIQYASGYPEIDLSNDDFAATFNSACKLFFRSFPFESDPEYPKRTGSTR